MNDTKSILARVLAQQEAKKAAQAAENQQLGASTERANVVPLKTEDQLYESGEIDRISNLVNTAVRLYLMKHYGYGSKE